MAPGINYSDIIRIANIFLAFPILQSQRQTSYLAIIGFTILSCVRFLSAHIIRFFRFCVISRECSWWTQIQRPTTISIPQVHAPSLKIFNVM